MKVGYNLKDKMNLFSMYMLDVECRMAFYMNMLMVLRLEHCDF